MEFKSRVHLSQCVNNQNLAVIEGWIRRDENLKELEEASVPNSQCVIEWDSSDSDNCTEAQKPRIPIIHKISNKKDSTLYVTNTENRESRTCNDLANIYRADQRQTLPANYIQHRIENQELDGLMNTTSTKFADNKSECKLKNLNITYKEQETKNRITHGTPSDSLTSPIIGSRKKQKTLKNISNSYCHILNTSRSCKRKLDMENNVINKETVENVSHTASVATNTNLSSCHDRPMCLQFRDCSKSAVVPLYYRKKGKRRRPFALNKSTFRVPLAPNIKKSITAEMEKYDVSLTGKYSFVESINKAQLTNISTNFSNANCSTLTVNNCISGILNCVYESSLGATVQVQHYNSSVTRSDTELNIDVKQKENTSLHLLHLKTVTASPLQQHSKAYSSVPATTVNETDADIREGRSIKYTSDNHEIASSAAADNMLCENSSSYSNLSQSADTSILIDSVPSPTMKHYPQDTIGNDDGRRFMDIIGRSTSEKRPDDRHSIKGSTWIKDIQIKTPDKNNQNCNEEQDFEPPDSTKKKFKKDGHADHFRRLLQSWQSSISMWNYQMAQADSNVLLPCSQSPALNAEALSNRRKSPTMISSLDKKRRKPHCVVHSEFSQNSKLDVHSEIHKESKIKDILSQSILRNQNAESCESPALVNNLKKLRSSLDISPALSSCLSGSKSSFMPQKHICLRVLSISSDYLASDTVAAECIEIDYCYRRRDASCRKLAGDEPDIKLENDKSSSQLSLVSDHKATPPEHGTRSKFLPFSLSQKLTVPLQLNAQKFLVLLNQFDTKNSKKLNAGDEIKIFAPWEVLDVENLRMPTIFASYFITTPLKFENIQLLKATGRDKLLTASWRCPCREGLVLPSLCNGGEMKRLFHDDSLTRKREKHIKMKDFETIQDSGDNYQKNDRVWTVLEAIEKSEGKPDVPVSVTARILRIIASKEATEETHPRYGKEPSYYMVIGQDPSGTFFTVHIPNRPLTSTLQSLLDDGEGTTQTLTHLTVSQRITDYPALFSLIKYFHSLYQEAIKSNDKLKIILEDQIFKPSQSFCYRFQVTLGKTEHITVAKSECLYFKEQLTSIDEALQNGKHGQRFKLMVNILYCKHPYAYVTCKKKEQGSKELVAHKFHCSIQKIAVKNSVYLPPWMGCDGTVMASVVIRDVLLTGTSKKGVLWIDEFSSVVRLKKEFQITLEELQQLIPRLTVRAAVHDLVMAEGIVDAVNEDDAYTWQECPHCNNEKLEQREGRPYCLTCNSHVSAVTKYKLEVTVTDLSDGNAVMNIRLFQRTVETLLAMCKSDLIECYDPELLLGRRIGPLVCVVESVDASDTNMTFSLLEMPY